MTMTKRDFLKAAAVAGAASLVPLYFSRSAFAGSTYTAEDFVSPLGFPVEYKGVVKNGKRVFDLTVQHGETQFFNGVKTATMGVNGGFLGPALRMNDGDEIAFNVKNKLNEPTILHWHGVHLPARMDGGPRFSIEPGGVWKPEWTVNQQASMQWFHSHQHNQTGEQVYQGIAGLFYIDDETSKNLDVPKEYGVDDIPLIIQDRNFNSDASFRYVSNMHEGMSGIQGDHIMVNGVVRPYHKVARRQMRLRLLNGSNARIYNLHFSDGRKFTQIASDGGFLENPVELDSIRLAPAERAEILVEFGANDDVMLSHRPNEFTSAGGGMGMMSMMSGNDDRPFGVMRFVTQEVGGDVASLSSKLVTLPNWLPSNAAKKRHFELDMAMGPRMMFGGGITINDKSYDMNRIDEVVKLNDIEIWEFSNNSPMPHPMHIHDIQFRILNRNGSIPPLNEQGLKDTVLVRPKETVQVITQFTHYADEKEPYMFHCHNLEHEDKGMMGQFLVTT